MTHRLLLDVSSLTYRAYFSTPDSVTAPDGRRSTRYTAIWAWSPVDRQPSSDEVVHVYDHDRRPVARTEIFPGYKANRPEEPEAITTQFALLKSARPHRPPPGADRALGGRGRDRRVLPRGRRGRPDRDRLRRSRPDPAGPRPRREAPVHPPRRVGARGVRRGARVREVRRAGVEVRGLRDPARRPLRRARVRGVGEKTARALVETYESLDDLLADAAQPNARPGPLKAPASRGSSSPPTTSPTCADWSPSTRSRRSRCGRGRATTKP